MNLKFSDQRDDQQPSEGEPAQQRAIEAADHAAMMAETSDAGGGSSSGKRAVSLSSFRALARVVGSQDYIGVLIATVVLVLGVGVFYPNFLSTGNLLDILSQATFVGILACGMAFLLAMRELDLSVGSIYALTSLCAALILQSGKPSWLGVIIGIVIGTVLGLTNGLLIQFFRLPSIVATLATMSIYRGLVYALSNGIQVVALPLTDPFAELMGSKPLGIPTNVWVMVVVVAILVVVLRATPFGYRVRSIGSNPEAAVFSGLPVKRVRLFAFALMGALGGLVGMLSLGYFGSSDPNLGVGYELLAIAAAVIGGTPLLGGRASMVGAVLGAALLEVVSAGLAYFNVPINWTAFATGLVILLAVSLDSLLRRGRARRNPYL